MTRLSALLLLTLTLWVTSPARVSAAAPPWASQKSNDGQLATTTYQHTKNFVRSFFRAYNKHDLQAVLSMVTTSVRYADCDWVMQQGRFAAGKSELKHLFQREFADGQQFLRLSVVASNPDQRYVAGAQFLQRTRSMRQHGLAPHASGFKIVLQSPRFEQINFFAGMGPTGCKR